VFLYPKHIPSTLGLITYRGTPSVNLGRLIAGAIEGQALI